MVRLNTDRAADPLAAGIERFVGLEHIEPEDLRIRRWGFVAEGTTFTNRFRPGQVLFGKRRAYQRKVALADFEGVCSSDIYVFESKDPDVLLPDLLPFLCQTEGFFQHAVGTSAGSLSPRTNWTQLAAYDLALPPLEEQRRIVEVLSAIDSVLDAVDRAIVEVAILRQAVLSDRTSSLRRKHWCTVSLADVAEPSKNSFVNGPFGSDLLTTDLRRDSGVPVIYIRDIRNGRFERVEDIFVSEEKARSLSTFSVVAGDLLVAKVGDPPGIAAVYPRNAESAIVTQDVIRIRPDRSKTSSEYLRAYLESPVGRQHIAHISIAGTRRRISLTDFKNMRCLLPPMSEQEEMVGVLHDIEAQRQPMHTRHEHLLRIRKEVMQRIHGT